jgi:hypothetical protein
MGSRKHRNFIDRENLMVYLVSAAAFRAGGCNGDGCHRPGSDQINHLTLWLSMLLGANIVLLQNHVEQRSPLKTQSARTSSQCAEVQKTEELFNFARNCSQTAVGASMTVHKKSMRLEFTFFRIVSSDRFQSQTFAGVSIVDDSNLTLSKCSFFAQVPMMGVRRALVSNLLGEFGECDIELDRSPAILFEVMRIKKVEFFYRRSSRGAIRT